MLFIILLILIFAALGLRCCTGFSLAVASRGYSLDAVCELLTVVASPIAEQGSSAGRLPYLQHMDSAVAAPGLYPEHRHNRCSARSLVTPRRLGSSWTRDRIHVSCIGRQILYR